VKPARPVCLGQGRLSRRACSTPQNHRRSHADHKPKQTCHADPPDRSPGPGSDTRTQVDNRPAP